MNFKNKKTVLIIDDSMFSRILMKSLLDEKYNVIMAESGVKGLELLMDKSVIIDLILLDLLMPGMDGYDVPDMIRKKTDLVAIPCIVITSYTDDIRLKKPRSYGAISVMAKPATPDIVRRIDEILNK